MRSCTSMRENGVSSTARPPSHFADRDSRLAVAGVSSSEPGDVEQLEGPRAVDSAPPPLLPGGAAGTRRPARRGSSRSDRGSGRCPRAGSAPRPAGVPLRAANRARSIRAREPGVLRRRGQSPRPLLLVRRQRGGPFEGERGGGEAAPPLRPLGRLLELLDRRTDRARRSPPRGARRGDRRRLSPSSTLASARWAACRFESGAAW